MTGGLIAASSAGDLALQVGPLALAGGLYARRARTLRTSRGVAAWRQVCFWAGLLVVAAALTALDSSSERLLSAHMAEHLLLGDLAPLLLVLGLTGRLIAPILRVGPINRARALSNPAVALPLWAANLYLWHVPALYEAALRHAPIHALEHVTFLALGVNLWMCLLGPLPTPRWFGGGVRACYVVAYWLVGTALAGVLIWSGHALYPFYAASDAAEHVSQLTDQKRAGGIMMIECSIVAFSLGSWLMLRAMRMVEERQALVRLAQAVGVTLSEERAARAVRSGRADELRRRLEAGPAGSPEPETAAVDGHTRT